MYYYFIKRLLEMSVVFLGITVVVYFFLEWMPGEPIDSFVSSAQFSQEELEQMKKSLGLDVPVHIRYLKWLKNILEGDLGYSYSSRQAVSSLIRKRMGPSLILSGSGFLIALFGGIPLGILSGYYKDTLIDKIASAIAFIGTVVPSFLISLLLIYFISVKFRALPLYGMYEPYGNKGIMDLLRHLCMPAISIALQSIGNFIKQTRTGIAECLNEDYIKVARAKGLSETKVLLKYALRNTSAPIYTTISLSVPYLVGGAVVTEQLFSWPGIGSLMISAITNRDYPVIMGITVLISTVVLISNFLGEFVQLLLNPRLRNMQRGRV